MWAPASFDETKTRDADNVDRQVIGRPTESICDFAAVRNANASRGPRIEAAVVARRALAAWRQSQVPLHSAQGEIQRAAPPRLTGKAAIAGPSRWQQCHR